MTVRELTVLNLRSLAWWGDDLIDWLGGVRVPTDGRASQKFGTGSTYRFDAAVGFGDVGVTFETLGTKGRIARWNGVLPEGNFTPLGIDELREIDRSYYHADDYTYPVCVFALPDGRAAIAHCPRRYDRLDLELVDGTALTPRAADAKHDDFFHSRLEASLDGRFLLSNGWIWQPWNHCHVFDVARALAEPAHLSTSGLALELDPDWEWEIDAATFVGDRLVIASSAEAHALAVHALPSGARLASHRLAEAPGTRLMAWGPDHVLAFDGHPRVIELATGTIAHRWDALDGGPGVHQPSVNMKPPEPPWLARDPGRARFALGWPDRVVVVTAT